MAVAVVGAAVLTGVVVANAGATTQASQNSKSHTPSSPHPSQQATGTGTGAGAAAPAAPQSYYEEEGQHPFMEPLDHVREEERPLHDLVSRTHFDLPTLRRLQLIFTDISESEVDDGIIDANELTAAMGLDPSCLLARTIFRLFDLTQTQQINFKTWVTTLSALSVNASLEEKIRFSFNLYDLNGDGSIDMEELRALLEAAIDENVLNLTPEEAKEWCDHTLSQVDKDKNGSVDYNEYRAMVSVSPKFLESFTLDIHALCRSFRFKSKRSSERLTQLEGDQRLQWFRMRQKMYQGNIQQTDLGSQSNKEEDVKKHSSDSEKFLNGQNNLQASSSSNRQNANRNMHPDDSPPSFSPLSSQHKQTSPNPQQLDSSSHSLSHINVTFTEEDGSSISTSSPSPSIPISGTVDPHNRPPALNRLDTIDEAQPSSVSADVPPVLQAQDSLSPSSKPFCGVRPGAQGVSSPRSAAAVAYHTPIPLLKQASMATPMERKTEMLAQPVHEEVELERQLSHE